jgi:hypothetical protein
MLFFSSGMASDRYLRTFVSNPTLRTSSPSLPEAIDISFGVPGHLEAKVLEILRSDFQSKHFPENIMS